METKDSKIDLFFNDTLKGKKFYFYCPNMANEDKESIINIIKENKGVRIYIIFNRQLISSKITKNIIIIVEEENSIKTPEFLKIINNYGNIFFNHNNHIKKIIHNSKLKEPIKVITYQELLLKISNFKNKSLDNSNNYMEKVFDTNNNSDAKISILLKSNTNENMTHLESYDFSYKDKNGNIYYDIPYYHEDVPDGFSVFCTDEEYKLVFQYINKNRKKSKEKNKINNIINEDISSSPEPTKKNYICHLCRVFFNNYKKHINSEKHKNMIIENKNSFKELTATFKKIVQDNKNEEDKEKLNSLELNEKDSYYCLRDKNNNLIEKYFDDYIICDKRIDINNMMKNDRDIPSTAYSSIKNSSINFEDIKFKKEI